MLQLSVYCATSKLTVKLFSTSAKYNLLPLNTSSVFLNKLPVLFNTTYKSKKNIKISKQIDTVKQLQPQLINKVCNYVPTIFQTSWICPTESCCT